MEPQRYPFSFWKHASFLPLGKDHWLHFVVAELELGHLKAPAQDHVTSTDTQDSLTTAPSPSRDFSCVIVLLKLCPSTII